MLTSYFERTRYLVRLRFDRNIIKLFEEKHFLKTIFEQILSIDATRLSKGFRLVVGIFSIEEGGNEK